MEKKRTRQEIRHALWAESFSHEGERMLNIKDAYRLMLQMCEEFERRLSELRFDNNTLKKVVEEWQIGLAGQTDYATLLDYTRRLHGSMSAVRMYDLDGKFDWSLLDNAPGDVAEAEKDDDELWPISGGRIPGCQSTAHTVCYGELWTCAACGKTVCYAEGTDDRPELCDACWVKASKGEGAGA